LEITQCADHFIQPAGMKNLVVQMMCVAVVPEIEPENVEA